MSGQEIWQIVHDNDNTIFAYHLEIKGVDYFKGDSNAPLF